MCSETQFSLRWNNFGSTMTSALNTLQQIGDFVDVTLATEGVQLRAHKVVLSACSPYFREILKSNPCQHPVIIMREVNIEDLESVLTFMYEGEVNVTQPRLHTFMRLAEALQVKGLTESSAPSPSTKNVSVIDTCHTVSLNDANSLSLDLSKKVPRVSSPRRDSPVQSAHCVVQRNNHQNEVHVRSQIRLADARDSPPATHASKRRRLSETNEVDSSVAQKESADSQTPETRHASENLLEVKKEPSEPKEQEGKDSGYEKSQHQLQNDSERTRSPTVVRQGTVSGSTVSSSQTHSHPTVQSDKRGTIISTPRVDKQSASYQPEFPQDPSCHQTLPYPCPFCEKSYTSWGFRRRHIKGYHTATSELPCKWCLAVLPSHQDWETHVTRIHSLTLTDAHNGILILEEAHMVLQIAQPTRIDSLLELIKEKKMREKEGTEREADNGEKGIEGEATREREKGRSRRSSRGETSH